MLRKYLSIGLVILFICIQSCNENNFHNISDNALSYLNEVLDILESNSINRNTIDWKEFREDVLTEAENITSIDSTYPVIKYALRKLGDNHSHFIENYSEAIRKAKTHYPYARLLEDSIAYIHIPGFMGNHHTTKSYASRLHSFVNSFAMKNVSGWILDLRENTGGNMWPMIAGIGPLLGEDVAGYFVDAEDNYISWYYKNGSSYSDDNKVCSIISDSSDVSIAYSKVAVLIGKSTASSGEAVAVSFKGKEDTKFFGEPTIGLSMANRKFRLSNAAMLVLTTAIFADREKKKYGKPIEPDVVIQNPEKINKKELDEVIITAMDWIKNNQ